MRKGLSSTRNEGKVLIERVNLNSSPFSIYKGLKNLPYTFFLDSALPSEKLGKFSFIGIEPFLIFKSKKNKIVLDWINKKEVLTGNPFLVLKSLFKRF